ncbi:hypothetical protein KJ359_010576 [Pestalotiopsis sp. 9143b]|nr:hypothetical protein KJ359_010576 [Pestalotiopsis sp. 9143b]
MSDVVWNKQAFRRLVLEEKTKDVLRALIDVRMSDSKKLDDLVIGKGNGLIMLLHGSPGTGKSLTAESVAEFAEKPLYRETCGDIGTDATAVEKYLETILYLAKIWDCVLLLDEADVFLEERSVSDLQRNSLVSVFLRVLEYYEGIMILTSNRVGTFDEAFQSRIRVALRYEPLSFQSRKAIWQNFFEMLVDDDKEIKPFHSTLHSDNKLKDAFLERGGTEDSVEGYTWGQQAAIKFREQSGYSRMDKVYFCGSLKLLEFARFGQDVLLPERVSDDSEESKEGDEIVALGFDKPWVTDHLGIWAKFGIESQDEGEKGHL